jgi:uncharacterized protein (TIGR00369 family)
VPGRISAPEDADGRAAAMAAALGYRVVFTGDGKSEIEWIPRPPWVNYGGTVFGGIVSALVDTVTGLAVASACGSDIAHLPTVSMHVDYLRPLTLDVVHTVRGEALRIGRRLAVADAYVTDPSGDLLVRGSVTMSLRGAKPVK